MRPIKYRGKSVDTGKFIYGYGVCLIEDEGIAVILHKQGNNLMQTTAVYPDSVGEFTGVTDKLEIEIYEDDIVQYSNGTKSIVKYEHDLGCCGYGVSGFYFPEYEKVLVIGNIHENPELLNSKTNEKS